MGCGGSVQVHTWAEGDASFVKVCPTDAGLESMPARRFCSKPSKQMGGEQDDHKVVGPRKLTAASRSSSNVDLQSDPILDSTTHRLLDSSDASDSKVQADKERLFAINSELRRLVDMDADALPSFHSFRHTGDTFDELSEHKLPPNLSSHQDWLKRIDVTLNSFVTENPLLFHDLVLNRRQRHSSRISKRAADAKTSISGPPAARLATVLSRDAPDASCSGS
ncbi:unnamed protein product [Polarella glacialis]|uniref:Uncharacterized protein n=1 Tax=Polarella glacialis TaxID=89957 RepID=A0A813J799_POLGL|nr:unnamed protein product [Polarella glacialis]|eukprot:CAMPEP_0115081080 /NCGR_PEP_ID=MMETSP0227-20121206/19054_1 /TAXON_ID=89957 /ORGANISM="Polarella glacialis, Strain CCMP 1383" /LENGTH=221 /DNA_ID=CAMNT_0002468833 /DNA_START=81 /DNA_END=746 /DNA_ORIENTATION=-